jgi:transcriptional regulator with XRE-family HTH domain
MVLRELCKEASLTGRALAQLTGLHYTKVSRVENGYPALRSQNILKNSFGAFRSVAARYRYGNLMAVTICRSDRDLLITDCCERRIDSYVVVD